MFASALRFTVLAAILLAAGSVGAMAQPVQGCPVGGHSVISCPVINDQVLLDAVRIRLSGIVTIPRNCVTVGVRDGVVILTGQVDSEARRDIAVLLAQSVQGVRGVEDRLTISPITIRDRELVVAVSNAIRRAGINPRFMNVEVSEGVVRLTGMVQTEADRDQAGLFAAGVPGVTGVHNNLTVQHIGITS